MELTTHSHCQNLFKIALLNFGAFLCLTSLFASPLAAQTWSTRPPIHYQISQSPNQSRGIAYERLEIGGVKLSMSEAQVIKVLGQPLEIRKGYEAVAGQTRTLRYSGLTVKLLEDVEPTGKFSVYEIEADSSRYATKDGVKVGDRVSTGGYKRMAEFIQP